MDSSDAFRLHFPNIAQVCLRGACACVQLIWLTAQLSSLHIALKKNLTQPKLIWPQKLARSNTPLTSSHVNFICWHARDGHQYYKCAHIGGKDYMDIKIKIYMSTLTFSASNDWWLYFLHQCELRVIIMCMQVNAQQEHLSQTILQTSAFIFASCNMCIFLHTKCYPRGVHSATDETLRFDKDCGFMFISICNVHRFPFLFWEM